MEIYRKYGPAVLRKCKRLLQNQQDAEDVTQGLFIDLLQSEKEPDLPYLYRAATNRCLNLIRDRQNRSRLLEQQDEQLRGPIRTRCDTRAIGLDLVVKLIDLLDDRSTEILVYHYFDDFTQQEIAKTLKISRRTVGKRLKKIQKISRELWQ